MSTGIFPERGHQPTAEELHEALGARRALWDELGRFVRENYAIAEEWSFGGKTWGVRYRKSGKTLLTLYPNRGGFVAQIVLGVNEATQALVLRLGARVGTILREARQLHDGRWLFINVKTARDVKDIEQLLQVKRRARPTAGQGLRAAAPAPRRAHRGAVREASE